MGRTNEDNNSAQYRNNEENTSCIKVIHKQQLAAITDTNHAQRFIFLPFSIVCPSVACWAIIVYYFQISDILEL